MKFISQRRSDDCGVAAFAMAMDLSYRQSMKLLHPKRFWWFSDATTYLKQMMDVLDSKNISYVPVDDEDTRDFHTLPYRAIVAVKAKKSNHAVVWNDTDKIVFDPAATAEHRGYDLDYCLNNFVAALIIKR